jgi:hypothetical protein
MSSPDAHQHELVVANDGSIPASQLAVLGLRPGTHLRVVESPPFGAPSSIAGSLPDFPDIAWEDFEKASALAIQDLSGR